jgi:hypothetical protein
MMSPPLGSTWLCRRQTSSFRATSVFPAPSYPGDEGAEVRAGAIMANAGVGLAHSGKTLDVVTALPNAALTAPRNVV